MSQLPDPVGHLKPEGQSIYDQIVGSRGHDYPGLFRTLMLYPELAQRFAEFGTLLRFDGVLRGDIRELAILTVARELRIAYIWATHQESAAKAGLKPQVIVDLLAAKSLAGHDPLYPTTVQVVQEFLAVQPIRQVLQDRLVASLGLPGFVQLSVVIGYYRLIAGLARGFEFPLPAGMADPFEAATPP